MPAGRGGGAGFILLYSASYLVAASETRSHGTWRHSAAILSRNPLTAWLVHVQLVHTRFDLYFFKCFSFGVLIFASSSCWYKHRRHRRQVQVCDWKSMDDNSLQQQSRTPPALLAVPIIHPSWHIFTIRSSTRSSALELPTTMTPSLSLLLESDGWISQFAQRNWLQDFTN